MASSRPATPPLTFAQHISTVRSLPSLAFPHLRIYVQEDSQPRREVTGDAAHQRILHLVKTSFTYMLKSLGPSSTFVYIMDRMLAASPQTQQMREARQLGPKVSDTEIEQFFTEMPINVVFKNIQRIDGDLTWAYVDNNEDEHNIYVQLAIQRVLVTTSPSQTPSSHQRFAFVQAALEYFLVLIALHEGVRAASKHILSRPVTSRIPRL